MDQEGQISNLEDLQRVQFAQQNPGSKIAQQV